MKPRHKLRLLHRHTWRQIRLSEKECKERGLVVLSTGQNIVFWARKVCACEEVSKPYVAIEGRLSEEVHDVTDIAAAYGYVRKTPVP